MPTDTPETVVETPETPAAPDTGADAVPEWDGGLDSLDKQPWWAGVPDPAKEHLRSQYERHNFFRTVVDSDDTAATLTKEMEGLRASLGAEVNKYKGEAEKYKGEAESWKTKHDTLSAERESERIAARDTEIKTKFADIYEDYARHETDEAKQNSPLAMFVQLTDIQGHPDDKAAKMVRAAFDMPNPVVAGAAAPAPAPQPKTRDVEPPDSVSLANRNGLNPAEAIKKPPPLTPEEARRKLLEEIEAKEEARGG